MSISLVRNNFIKNLLTTKSNESKSVFLIEQASSPYNKIGTHLVFGYLGFFGWLEVLWCLGVLGCLGVTVKRLRV